MKIFIVDDSYDARSFIFRTLEDAGYSDLVMVSSGEEALEQLGQGNELQLASGQMVLLDIGLPNKDGIEICREIHSRFQFGSIVVLIITVREKSKYLPLALEAGAHDFINKPIDQSESLARVKKATNFLKFFALYREQQDTLEQCYVDLLRSNELGREIKGGLALCLSCHKVKSQPSKWESLRQYLEDHTGFQFTETQCDHCQKVDQGQ